MNNTNYLLSGALLLASIDAGAGIFTSNGKSFEECMENRRGDIKNLNQHAIAASYCRQKHPLPPQSIIDPFLSESVELYRIDGTDAKNASARSKISLLSIARVSLEHDGSLNYGFKSYDFKWYTGLVINNRNGFPVSSVIVGIPKSGVRQCGWGENDYVEVYDCKGRADAKMTGQFKCYIPGIEKRRLDYCVIGLGIEGTISDVNKYMKGDQ